MKRKSIQLVTCCVYVSIPRQNVQKTALQKLKPLLTILNIFFNWDVKPHCLTRINKIFHILCALTSPSHYNRFEIVKGIIDIFYELLSYFSNQASTRCNALHGYKTCFIVEVLLQVTVARFRRHIFYEFHG